MHTFAVSLWPSLSCYLCVLWCGQRLTPSCWTITMWTLFTIVIALSRNRCLHLACNFTLIGKVLFACTFYDSPCYEFNGCVAVSLRGLTWPMLSVKVSRELCWKKSKACAHSLHWVPLGRRDRATQMHEIWWLFISCVTVVSMTKSWVSYVCTTVIFIMYWMSLGL